MMTPIRMTPCHTAAVAALESATFAEPWSAHALELLCRPGGLGVVILPKAGHDTAAAYAGMTYVLDEGAVTNIAVRSDLRGQGLGHAVLVALMSEARSVGVRTLFLEVRPSNTAALALYRAHGFCEVGRRKHFYRFPTEDALLLSLDLAQQPT